MPWTPSSNLSFTIHRLVFGHHLKRAFPGRLLYTPCCGLSARLCAVGSAHLKSRQRALVPVDLTSLFLPLSPHHLCHRLVFGHGFLTKDGLKMGKSMGNTLDPFELVNTYGPDAVRFFFMREIVFG